MIHWIINGRIVCGASYHEIAAESRAFEKEPPENRCPDCWDRFRHLYMSKQDQQRPEFQHK